MFRFHSDELKNFNGEKFSKKEEGIALSNTLFNYGMSSSTLSKVKITIETQSGWSFV